MDNGQGSQERSSKSSEPSSEHLRDNGQGSPRGSSEHPLRVPAWLAELGIKEGEYFSDAKPRLKAAMKRACFDREARVYACLVLHSMGFQQQRCVRMEAGKRVPLTPQDIAGETGICKQNIRPVLNRLQDYGLIEIRGSTKGRIEIYTWTKPGLPDQTKMVIARDYHFSALPEDLKPLESYYKRWKIPVPAIVLTREQRDELLGLARDYEKAKMVLARALKGNRARDDNKEEITEINSEINAQSSSSAITTLQPPSEPAPQTSPPKADEDDSSFEKLKAHYPKQRMDEGKAMKAFYILKIPERRAAVRALPKFVGSARWQDKEGQFVPFASKWLLERQWEAEPPPVFKPAVRANSVTGKSFEESREMIRQALEQERAAKRAEPGK